jgi:hypothetical protein
MPAESEVMQQDAADTAQPAEAAVEMPWLDASTLDKAKKREIVEFLQDHMSIDDLRSHKLLGKLAAIAKKASKGQLHTVYMLALADPTLLMSEESKEAELLALADAESAAKKRAEEAVVAAQAAAAEAAAARKALEDEAAANTHDPAEDEHKRHEATLIRWYTEYDPEKLSTVADVLRKYKGTEYKLWQELGMKYGPEPGDAYVRRPLLGVAPSPQRQGVSLHFSGIYLAESCTGVVRGRYVRPAPAPAASGAVAGLAMPRLLELAIENNVVGLCCGSVHGAKQTGNCSGF